MIGDAAAHVSPGVYLRSSLDPFAAALSRADVTDIYVNRTGEIWIETVTGSIERIESEAVCELSLARFARQVAALTHQGISREHPLLAATLPDGARVQVVAPPATRGPLALAIRKQIAPSMTLADFAVRDFSAGTDNSGDRPDEEQLRSLIASQKFTEALALAVRSRRNILVSGGTSTGKTTFLNALLREVPRAERLILIEDSPEIEIDHENSVGLLAVRGALGEANVTANDLVSASLRMRPDRIILGELRGPEAFAFLRAINSGHPGSMTTIHADSPRRAIEQLAMLVLHDAGNFNRSDVHHYVNQSIDVFVHLGRNAGQRAVEAVALASAITAI